MPENLSSYELAEKLERLSSKVGEFAGDVPSAMLQGATALRRQAALIEASAATPRTVAILFSKQGRAAQSPKLIEATVSWSAQDGVAQAFDASGRMVAKLHNARIDWIEAGGVRISGMEPTDSSETAFRTQAWQIRL
ncbi:hypothetical protein B447_15074 [Thauera sp. 27]|uniref:hypothetical protein n=1 Tax=Thauera sp. 27 TaxID=305700 RepID=UPI0002CE5381|nr:hypothetical protein [Thauera sp. 27]ENO78046.1 hypothetical protein B447_15074 [Thauera sp. 27]